MIIINEYNYVKEIMESNKIPDKMSIKKLMLYIAKYYFDGSRNWKEYRSFIFERIKEFDLPQTYQEYKYNSYLEDICKRLLSGDLSHSLKKVEFVNIYKSEISNIDKCDNDKQKKLLFTLYVLAKVADNNGWVNYDLKDIFQLANITATIQDRVLLMHELYKKGLIQQSKRNDKNGYKIELGLNNEEIALTVNLFENIGNQYIAKFKPGCKMCECCGKLFKIKSHMDFSSKYCKQCAYKINLEKQKDRDLNKILKKS